MRNAIRWGIVAAGMLAMGWCTQTAQASHLVSQPALVQALSPAVAGGWYRAGWRGCCGWGRYYYGRPVIYSGYRPYYRTWYAAPAYSAYTWSTPVYTAPVVSTWSSGYAVAPAYAAPVYTTPVYSVPYAYTAAYRVPAYRIPAYRASVYTAVPYSTMGYGWGYGYGSPYMGVPYSAAYAGYGIPVYSPYRAWYGMW